MPRSANDPTRLTPVQTAATAARLASLLGGDANPYSVPKELVSNMATLGTALATENALVESTLLAYRSAVAAREAKKGACDKAISLVCGAVFAVPSNTPAMITALGLKPRSTTRTKVVPQRPMDLVAIPSDDSSVLLKWNRMSNPDGVLFQVEGRDSTGVWRILDGTTRASLKVYGFNPGMSASFRITASKNGMQSTPSPEATIYPAAPAPALRLAA